MAKRGRSKPVKTMNGPVMYRVLDELLNKKVLVIAEFADLPRRWREAPSEASDRKHPSERTKEELLARYVAWAPIYPWAREGLDSLYRELLMTGEPIPYPLLWWDGCLGLLGDPPLKAGRPRNLDRDVRVSTAFKFLGTFGYTREAAIDKIAEVMSDGNSETVRTIIHNYRISIRS